MITRRPCPNLKGLGPGAAQGPGGTLPSGHAGRNSSCHWRPSTSSIGPPAALCPAVPRRRRPPPPRRRWRTPGRRRRCAARRTRCSTPPPTASVWMLLSPAPGAAVPGSHGRSVAFLRLHRTAVATAVLYRASPRDAREKKYGYLECLVCNHLRVSDRAPIIIIVAASDHRPRILVTPARGDHAPIADTPARAAVVRKATKRIAECAEHSAR